MALLKLNNQLHCLNGDTVTVTPVSNGRWSVQMDDLTPFIVVGGRKSGGARNEWFCYDPKLYGETWVPCKSMIAAIRMGCSY